MKPILPLLLFLTTLARAQNLRAQDKQTRDTLTGLIGSYCPLLDPSLQFNIKRDKDQLILEVVGQGQTPMTGLGNDRFRPKQVNPPAIVAFVRDNSGKAVRFRWIQDHKSSNGEWLEDSAAAAGPGNKPGYAGRYHLKNNPYKIIRIREQDGRLTGQLDAGSVFDLQPDGPNKYDLTTGSYTMRFEFVPARNKYKLLTREEGDLDFSRQDDAAAAAPVDNGFPPDRGFGRADSLRGMLTPLRTCYDVSFYGLDIAVDPATQSIQGSANIRFTAVQPFSRIQIDLFANLTIEKILFHGKELAYTREFNAVFIDFPSPVPQGATEAITILYAGKPQVPNIAILKGGFIWFADKQGNPWIESVCQGSGASLWWPCKDHLSDKPDSMKISITVPTGLTDISNGRLLDSVALPDHHTRFDWYVDYPIPNYDAVVNIGRYVQIADTLIRGPDTLNLHYYCIEHNEEKANRIFALVKPMLRLYEKDFGEYPFQKDGFTLMESLYGMEHQGAVSFGPVNNPVGSDHFDFNDLSRVTWHESAHEWWGNSITCKDFADMWIHEAFATYAEVLAYEKFDGKAAAQKYLNQQIPENKRPIIGTYDVNDFHEGDMYSKGCRMLNTLRHCIGNDSLWFALLHGLQNRFRYQSVTTKDIVGYIDNFTKTNYTPFFDQYLRHDAIPKLQLMTDRRGDTLALSYRWKTDVDGFDMPIELYNTKGARTRLSPTNEWHTIRLPQWTAANLQVDTDDFYVDIEVK